MKSRLFSVFFILLLAVSLVGCNCSHDWTEADCVNPQTCAKCQEVGATALGHEWQDATCTNAQVCSRCGTLQGEALGHSYGEWELGEDQMSHTCLVCSYVETTEIDRELCLESLLPGYWDFFGMYTDTGYTPAAKVNILGIGFHFSADKTATFHMPETGTQQVTWSFDSYKQENGSDSYYFTLTGETQTYTMCLRHNLSGETTQPEKELILLSKPLLLFSQYDSLNDKLVGNWGITTDQWGNILGNPGNWLTFRADRTVSGNLNGAIEGVWYVVANYYTSFLAPDNYSILIETDNGDVDHVLTFTPGTKSSLDVRIGAAIHRFSPSSEKALEQIKIANEIHLGTWTSTEVQYLGQTERMTSDYSVTFHADGTFTANLGNEFKGSWMLRRIVDASDNDWTNGNENPTYMYYMFADGLSDEIYCEVTEWSDRFHFIIHNFGPMDGRQIEFVQYSEEEYSLMMQHDTYLIGTWPARSYYIKNNVDNTRTEDEHPENHFFTFHEDGTFTALLEEEMAGIWEFEDLDYSETSTGNYWELDYLLTFDGQSEPMRIHVELKETVDFWIYMPLPENGDYEIVAGFPKPEK